MTHLLYFRRKTAVCGIDTEFRLYYQPIEIERFFRRDCCPGSLNFKSRGRNIAKLMSVLIAELKLHTEGKFYDIDSVS